MSYGLTADLLEEVLPLQTNRMAVYRHIERMAERSEQELGDEQVSFIEGCPRDWADLPIPDGPLTVGIDGGYVHGRDEERRQAGSFEFIAGKSIPDQGRPSASPSAMAMTPSRNVGCTKCSSPKGFK